jgi:hypothetical protein
LRVQLDVREDSIPVANVPLADSARREGDPAHAAIGDDKVRINHSSPHNPLEASTRKEWPPCPGWRAALEHAFHKCHDQHGWRAEAENRVTMRVNPI